MRVLTNGYLMPETPDPGATWFPALEENIQRCNDHTHNGTNSERLSADAVIALTQSIAAAGWTLVSVGSYTQLVVLPAPLLFDEVNIQIRLTDGTIVHPTITKAAANAYNVLVNDNTLDLTAVYT